MTLGEYAFAGDCFCGLDSPNLTAPVNVVLTAELTVMPQYELSFDNIARYDAGLDTGLNAQEQ